MSHSSFVARPGLQLWKQSDSRSRNKIDERNNSAEHVAVERGENVCILRGSRSHLRERQINDIEAQNHQRKTKSQIKCHQPIIRHPLPTCFLCCILIFVDHRIDSFEEINCKILDILLLSVVPWATISKEHRGKVMLALSFLDHLLFLKVLNRQFIDKVVNSN